MGTYVHYYFGQKDGIETAIFENIPNLIKCLEQCRNEYPDEFDPKIYAMALHMEQNGRPSLRVNSEEAANLIDRVVDSLVFYEDIASLTNINFQLFERINTSNMKWHRYPNSLRNVLPGCSNFAEFWYMKLLYDGSSIADLDGHKYTSDDGVFRISWILPEEIHGLIFELKPIELLNNWNDDEQHGIHIIYDALCKAKEKNCALVVQIV